MVCTGFLSGKEWFLMTVRPVFIALSPVWSVCCSVPRSPRLLLPPPSVLSGVMVTDPSGTTYPGIPEQLYGSSASVALRPGDERGGGKDFFSLPLSNTIESYYSLCALFFCRPNSEHLWIPRLLLWHLLTHKLYVLNKITEKNILFAGIMVSKSVFFLFYLFLWKLQGSILNSYTLCRVFWKWKSRYIFLHLASWYPHMLWIQM